MKITVGGAERRARSTSSYSLGLTAVNFAYTVTVADFNADGIAVPANSIVSNGWLGAGTFTFVNRGHRALSNQAAHKVVGNAASISAARPCDPGRRPSRLRDSRADEGESRCLSR